MEIKIRAQNVELTEALRGYAEEKINKLSRFFDQILEAEIELITAKNPSISNGKTVEVTLYTKGHVVRGKESSTDIFASIDLVSDKLERQLKKYRDKMYSSAHRHNQAKENLGTIVAEEEEREIVAVKQVVVKPMTPEEATLQIDLLGYEFFVFTNSDTEEVNVVYRRHDGNYGLIVPA